MLILRGFEVTLGAFSAVLVALIVWWFVLARSGGVMIPMSSLFRSGSFLVGAGLGTTLVGAGIWLLGRIGNWYVARIFG